LDKNIEVLKGWLEIYNSKMKPAMPAAKS
jgi:hypothetical protein